MIKLAEEADEEYGRLLREGLLKANDTSTERLLSNIEGDKAPEEAIKKGHDADSY